MIITVLVLIYLFFAMLLMFSEYKVNFWTAFGWPLILTWLLLTKLLRIIQGKSHE